MMKHDASSSTYLPTYQPSLLLLLLPQSVNAEIKTETLK